MKRLRIITFTICFMLLMTVGVSAHGEMTTVYKEKGNVVYYEVIPEEQIPTKDIRGWRTGFLHSSLGGYIPMYSNDNRIIIVKDSLASEYSAVGWYHSPRTIMFSPDGRTITVSIEEIEEYEKVGWYIEPVGLMVKNGEYRWIISSEIQKFRSEGWMLQEYAPELYDLLGQIKKYLEKKDGQFGVYVKNLKTGEYMVLNDNRYSAASIIKLFVMAGVYNEASYGGISKNNTVSNYLKSMITVSDNYSSNYLVKTMGKGDYKAGFTAENRHNVSLGCYNTEHNSLFIGYGDYVSYGKNVVSPMDCGILLEKIYDGTLISKEYSAEMLELLKGQQRRNKIPYLLPEGTICANKTGETSTVESDVGIVYSPGCDYVICVISNNASNGITDIRNISLMTYNYFNK